MTKDKPKLSRTEKAKQRRVRQLQKERRDLRRNFYHPAISYGCEPALDMDELLAPQYAEIDAEIAKLTEPEVPVLVGVVVERPTLW